MNHAQAVALVDAMLYVEEMGIADGETCERISNAVFVKALGVAAPDLSLRYTHYSPWQKAELPRASYPNQIANRKKLGAFLQEWGEALQKCEVEPS